MASTLTYQTKPLPLCVVPFLCVRLVLLFGVAWVWAVMLLIVPASAPDPCMFRYHRHFHPTHCFVLQGLGGVLW